MATDWFLELLGDGIDLDRLTHAFTEPPVTVRKDRQSHYLRNESLNDLNDVEDVEREFHETLLTINTLAWLQGGDFEDVTPGRLGHANKFGEICRVASDRPAWMGTV
jgi:hypothetical protein